jgi:hypothetical protein
MPMSDHSTSGGKETSPMLVKVTKPGAEELEQVHTPCVADRPAQTKSRDDTSGAYWRMRTRRWWLQVALLFVLAATAGAAPATAVGDRYYGHDTSYAGLGTQFGAWDESDRELRLKAAPSSQMSTTRCMDAMLDW